MKRHLCCAALFALVVIPDWAGACWPPGDAPYQPTYYVPAYYYTPNPCPPIYYAPPVYVPAQPRVVNPPRIEPVKDKGSTLIEPARPIAQPNPAPSKPPVVEPPIRPIGGSDAPKPPEGPPVPHPAPVPAPEPPKTATPGPKLPPIELPKTDAPAAPKLPPLELPKPAVPAVPEPKLPPIELPKTDAPAAPKLPPLEVPGGTAIPTPAPAPDALIPPPGIPNKPDVLPPLTLPPETPVAPEKGEKPVEAKSSPLNGTPRELKVSVFPATGTMTATSTRKVGFYNHTKRDLSLTIEGKSVSLPAMSYIHAQVPASFTWKCGDKPATKETIPADAAGVDVLIRE